MATNQIEEFLQSKNAKALLQRNAIYIKSEIGPNLTQVPGTTLIFIVITLFLYFRYQILSFLQTRVEGFDDVREEVEPNFRVRDMELSRMFFTFLGRLMMTGLCCSGIWVLISTPDGVDARDREDWRIPICIIFALMPWISSSSGQFWTTLKYEYARRVFRRF